MTQNREKFLNQRKDWHLKQVFGITLEDYNKLLSEQGGVCKICLGKDSDRMLAVDHCHTAGKIRGLLCQKCNRAIGQLDDSIERLKRAIIYLS